MPDDPTPAEATADKSLLLDDLDEKFAAFQVFGRSVAHVRSERGQPGVAAVAIDSARIAVELVSEWLSSDSASPEALRLSRLALALLALPDFRRLAARSGHQS